MHRLPLFLVLLIVLALTCPTPARATGVGRAAVPAAEVPGRPPAVIDQYTWDRAALIRDWNRWNVRLTIPLWVPGITGSFGSGSGNVEGPDGDAFERLFDADGSLSFALMGRIEVRRGRWALNADGFAATITENISFNAGEGERIASGDVTGILVRGDINYDITERWFRVRGRPTRLRMRAYAGVRSYNIHLDVKQVLGTDIQEDVRSEWIDPIVGLRLGWDVSHKFSILLEGDIGGFGVGSEMAYWGSAFVKWRFTRAFGVAIGYSILDFERRFRFARERFKWNATLSGPTLALTLKF